MPKVVIHREGGQTIEISDLTFDQVKELAGVNGHNGNGARPNTMAPRRVMFDANAVINTTQFVSELSARARGFIAALKSNPAGIEANDLAPKLGFDNPRQIGGFTGGSLAKTAEKFHIRMSDLYVSKVSFPNKKRTRTFYPGKLTKELAL